MNPYQYTPLENGQIRLLQILPGPDTDPVSCELFIINLEDLPDYTALSYAWGAGDRDKTIIVDGKTLSVGTNLDDALREFRSRPVWTGPLKEPYRICSVLKSARELRERYSPPGRLTFLEENMPHIDRGYELIKAMGNTQDEVEKSKICAELSTISGDLEISWGKHTAQDGVPRIHRDMPLIWIDAICIDQGNSVERMEQVKMMKDIYKGAFLLTVWLGVEADESSKAMSVLRQIQVELAQSKSTATYLETKMLDPVVQDAVYPIWQLLSRSWFGRLWILQEYALGGHSKDIAPQGPNNNVVFCCGRDRINNLVGLGHVVSNGITASPRLASDYRALVVNRIVSIDLLRYLVIFSGNLGESRNQLLSLIIQSSTAYATDPRDKIYACIGLAEEIFHGPPNDLDYDALIFDYTATVEDVFSSFVRATVLATNRLDILGLCTRGSSILVTRSWTPDWTLDLNGILCIDLSTTVRTDRLLTYDVAPGTESIAKFAPDLSTLTVRGSVWDSIREMSSIFETNNEALVKTELSILSRMAMIFSNSKKGQRAIDHYTSFCRTLSWGRNHQRKNGAMPESWVQSFEEWLLDQPLKNDTSSLEPISTSPKQWASPRSEFMDALLETIGIGYRIIVTSGGCIGRTICEVRSNDVVCIILGCAMPMILRPVEDHYEVVGEVYLDVIMHGEGMEAVREGKRTLQDFELH